MSENRFNYDQPNTPLKEWVGESGTLQQLVPKEETPIHLLREQFFYEERTMDHSASTSVINDRARLRVKEYMSTLSSAQQEIMLGLRWVPNEDPIEEPTMYSYLQGQQNSFPVDSNLLGFPTAPEQRMQSEPAPVRFEELQQQAITAAYLMAAKSGYAVTVAPPDLQQQFQTFQANTFTLSQEDASTLQALLEQKK